MQPIGSTGSYLQLDEENSHSDAVKILVTQVWATNIRAAQAALRLKVGDRGLHVEGPRGDGKKRRIYLTRSEYYQPLENLLKDPLYGDRYVFERYTNLFSATPFVPVTYGTVGEDQTDIDDAPSRWCGCSVL